MFHQELLSMTTTLREIYGLTTACRSESMAFDRRTESALNRLQEERSWEIVETISWAFFLGIFPG
jgi:hypothetical protein